jgi:hypothetical protein
VLHSGNGGGKSDDLIKLLMKRNCLIYPRTKSLLSLFPFPFSLCQVLYLPFSYLHLYSLLHFITLSSLPRFSVSLSHPICSSKYLFTKSFHVFLSFLPSLSLSFFLSLACSIPPFILLFSLSSFL